MSPEKTKGIVKGKEPVPGYDKLKDKEVAASLSGRTQAELEQIEAYERAHKGRRVVFDKLRYLRQKEPLPGYDALDVGQVIDKLQNADLAALKRVRGYERKFGARRDVLEEVDRLHRNRRVPLVSRDSAT